MFDPLKTTERNLLNTGKNWVLYKYGVESYAKSIKAFDVLRGKELRPEVLPLGLAPTQEMVTQHAQQAANLLPSQTIWDGKNEKLFSLIRFSQTEETICHIADLECADVFTAWSALCDFYESKTRASIKQLIYKLMNIKQTQSMVA